LESSYNFYGGLLGAVSSKLRASFSWNLPIEASGKFACPAPVETKGLDLRGLHAVLHCIAQHFKPIHFGTDVL